MTKDDLDASGFRFTPSATLSPALSLNGQTIGFAGSRLFLIAWLQRFPVTLADVRL